MRFWHYILIYLLCKFPLDVLLWKARARAHYPQDDILFQDQTDIGISKLPNTYFGIDVRRAGINHDYSYRTGNPLLKGIFWRGFVDVRLGLTIAEIGLLHFWTNKTFWNFTRFIGLVVIGFAFAFFEWVAGCFFYKWRRR